MLTAMLPLIAACTITTPSAPPPSRPGSSAPPTQVTAPTPTAKPGSLLCADAYATQPSGSTPVAFTPAGVGFDSLSKAGFDPIPATEGDLHLPADAPQYFTKSPIYLSNGVTWAEITLIHGDPTLAWVPATVWTGPPGWSLAPYLAKAARFESCNGSYTGFLGGILTATANECITLGIQSNLHPEVEPLEVSIGKHACR
jgi:hypothetical protein